MVDEIREYLEESLGTIETTLIVLNEKRAIMTEAAKVVRVMYDELIKQGFTEEQAMALMQGFSSAFTKTDKK
jgi:hypothetical protein